MSLKFRIGHFIYLFCYGLIVDAKLIALTGDVDNSVDGESNQAQDRINLSMPGTVRKFDFYLCFM